jgi:hypothetical protein
MTEHINGPDKPRSRFGYKKGWQSIARGGGWRMDVRRRLQQLVESPHSSDEVKTKASNLLSEAVDDRLPNASFKEARKLIKENNLFSKVAIKRAKTADVATSHAVFMACQACENLRDRTIKIGSRSERNKMLLQIAVAITVLGETQSKLLGGSDDSQR